MRGIRELARFLLELYRRLVSKSKVSDPPAWKLHVDPTLGEKHGLDGWCCPETKTIHVDPGQATNDYLATLVHEALHGAMRTDPKRPRWLSFEREEALIRQLEYQLLQILLDIGFTPPRRKRKKPPTP